MRSRLRAGDVLPVGTVGLRTRRVRAALSALGVAIGIAAMVGVLGITRSSQADLLAQVDRLGTNLLTVTSGRTIAGGEAKLPPDAPGRIGRTEGVTAAASTAELTNVQLYRTDRIPRYRSGGLAVRAADPAVLSTLDGRLARGAFLDTVTVNYPTTVLGYSAAKFLGIANLTGAPQVYLGQRWYAVIGILEPFELAPELDNSALIGMPVATRDFGFDGHPSRIYVRTETDRTAGVAGMLARSTNPRDPEEVSVSRPSDALAARLAIAGSTTTLFLGLGAVALLVGGIGIANVMVISVLERRNEIGLRRALGAARVHVATQFLVESLLLGTAGGVLGVLFGAAVTYTIAYQRDWQPLIPPAAVWTGLVAAGGIGAVAGLYPALRAARLLPTEALRAL
jgi:putative ABC transport system permease protein